MTERVEYFTFPGKVGAEVLVAQDENGEFMFCLRDISAVLGYANTSTLYKRVAKAEKILRQRETPGGAQEVTFVNQASLYRLMLNGGKGSPKDVIDWVEKTVIPRFRSEK